MLETAKALHMSLLQHVLKPLWLQHTTIMSQGLPGMQLCLLYTKGIPEERYHYSAYVVSHVLLDTSIGLDPPDTRRPGEQSQTRIKKISCKKLSQGENGLKNVGSIPCKYLPQSGILLQEHPGSILKTFIPQQPP